jgi:hypothetical protein
MFEHHISAKRYLIKFLEDRLPELLEDVLLEARYDAFGLLLMGAYLKPCS